MNILIAQELELGKDLDIISLCHKVLSYYSDDETLWPEMINMDLINSLLKTIEPNALEKGE
jgi:hypothetical protein